MTISETHEITEELPFKTRIYDYLPGKLETIRTRKGIKKALSKRNVLLNDTPAHSGDYVKKGDIITLLEPDISLHKVFPLKVTVHYEDDWLAIVEKPAGLITSGNYYKTLHNCLPHNLTQSPQKDALPYPLTIHRLDKSTSGLVIIAKTYASRVALGQLLEKKAFQKYYYAIVQGYLNASGELNSPIGEKSALTSFQTICAVPCKRNGSLTLIRLSPITGRTHQLRIHLARLGYPIYGDQLHGDPNNTKKNKGLFLFAYRLTFKHPITAKIIDVTAPTPQKFLRYFSI